MSDKIGAAGSRSKKAQKGLWRLMLKLPAVRGRLQMIAAQSNNLDGLFEAYEDAFVALQQFQQERDRSQCPLIEEYEALCSEIESDVLSTVLDDLSL